MRLLGLLRGIAALSAVQWGPSLIQAIDTYDVVVVGSGPGGLMAAEYLSRDSNIKVLVLEAGGPSLQASGGTDVPDYARSKGFTKFDIPGEYDAAGSIFNGANAKYKVDYIDDAKLYLAQLVGGCSSVNAALYFRTPDSYVDAAKWPFSASEVSQHFDEIEQIFGHTDLTSPDGKRYLQDGYDIVSRALKNQGGYVEKTLNDANARNAKSKTFGHPPFAIKNGLRDSPAKTCWGAMAQRSNVKLLTSAKVSYIKHTNGRATGVVYNDNVEVQVSAQGAVIMAAGAIGTPKVLIQSSIGPQDQLNSLKALGGRFPGVKSSSNDWIVNENVGKSLFDTTLVMPTFQRDSMKAFFFGSKPQSDIDQYMSNQTGPLSFSGPLLISYENYPVNGRAYEFQMTILTHGMDNYNTANNAFTAALYINNPESRDYCSFDASGRYRAFTQGSAYMSSANDLKAMQDYTQKVVKMLEADGSKFVSANSGQSVSDWVASKRGTWTLHYGGTCYASSDTSDRSRCADEKLRVVGTSNIFVGDGSAMKEGTVNPYGFIMYIGRQVGAVVKEQLAQPQTPTMCATLETDTDYSGADVANVPSSDASGCCAFCQVRSNCKAFTWTNFNGGTCWLKSDKGTASSKSGAKSAVISTSSTNSLTCSSVEENVDYNGNNVGSALSNDVTGCCALCSARSDCKAYTWTNYNSGTCWFKSSKGSTTAKSGARSAVLSTATGSSGCSIEENVDLPGNDLASVPSADASGCCPLCKARTTCKAFTWTNYNGGTCWLKTGKGSSTSKAGARSGVIV